MSADKPKSDTMKDLLKDATAEPPRPTASSTGPDVAKMPFTPDSIKQVMAYYQPQIQSCYEETLAVREGEGRSEGKLITSLRDHARRHGEGRRRSRRRAPR